MRIAAAVAGLVGALYLVQGVSDAVDISRWENNGIVATGIIVNHDVGNIIGEFTDVDVKTETGDTVRVMLSGTVGSVGEVVELTYLPGDLLTFARPGDWSDNSWLNSLMAPLFIAGVAFMVMTALLQRIRANRADDDR